MPTKGGMTYGADVAQFVENPQPGDYFSDHFSAVCFVEEREPHSVCVRKPDHKNGVWCDDTEWILLTDFTKWLGYTSSKGYWVERSFHPEWLEVPEQV